MNKDTEEFFDLVGSHSESARCKEFVYLTLTDKNDGTIICEDLQVCCGFTHTDNPNSPKCVGCDHHVMVCDCGIGIACNLFIPDDVPICSAADCKKYGG